MRCSSSDHRPAGPIRPQLPDERTTWLQKSQKASGAIATSMPRRRHEPAALLLSSVVSVALIRGLLLLGVLAGGSSEETKPRTPSSGSGWHPRGLGWAGASSGFRLQGCPSWRAAAVGSCLPLNIHGRTGNGGKQHSSGFLMAKGILRPHGPISRLAEKAWERMLRAARKKHRHIIVDHHHHHRHLNASLLISSMVSMAATPAPVAAAAATLANLSASATNQPRALEYVAVSPNGTSCRGRILKSDLSAMLGCPMRDLRLIDINFPYSGGAMLVRPNGVMLCINRVRAVLTSDQLLLFDPDCQHAQMLLPVLEGHLASGYISYASETAFEHLVLEAVLANACHRLHERLQHLAPQIFRILGDLRFRHGTLSSFTKLLDELLPLRNGLSEVQSSVAEMRKAIHDVLNSDEDMAGMYLTSAMETGVDREVSQHQEIEMMFENYLMQVEWSESEIREIQQAIKNTEDTVEMQLDLLRNRILRFELLMNVCQMVLGVGALVSGVFGMNLPNGWESCPRAFWRVSAALVGGMVGMFAGASWYGKRAKVL